MSRYVSLLPFLSLILFTFYSCNAPADVPNTLKKTCKGGSCSHSFVANSDLLIVRDNEGVSVLTDPGDKLVFTFQYEVNDNPRISDDEYTELIRFEIEGDETSFRFEDDQLENITAVMSAVCFCAPRERVVEISEGFISGEKIDEDSWQIEADISFEYSETRYRRVMDTEFNRQ